jgi:hypothetical protein
MQIFLDRQTSSEEEFDREEFWPKVVAYIRAESYVFSEVF